MPYEWDQEADVIVVGFGAAGMAASVTAHDLGAKVVILEKAPEGQGVGGDEPLQIGLGEVEAGVDRRDGHVHDGGVEHHHQLGGEDDGENH